MLRWLKIGACTLYIYIKAITYDHTMVPSTDTFFLALQELNDATSDAIVSCISESLSEHGLGLGL